MYHVTKVSVSSYRIKEGLYLYGHVSLTNLMKFAGISGSGARIGMVDFGELQIRLSNLLIRTDIGYIEETVTVPDISLYLVSNQATAQKLQGTP